MQQIKRIFSEMERQLVLKQSVLITQICVLSIFLVMALVTDAFLAHYNVI